MTKILKAEIKIKSRLHHLQACGMWSMHLNLPGCKSILKSCANPSDYGEVHPCLLKAPLTKTLLASNVTNNVTRCWRHRRQRWRTFWHFQCFCTPPG